MPTTYIVKHICCSHCGGRFKYEVRGGSNNPKYEQRYYAVIKHEETCRSNPVNRTCFTCRYRERIESQNENSNGSHDVNYVCVINSPRAVNLITKHNRLLDVASKCEDWEA